MGNPYIFKNKSIFFVLLLVVLVLPLVSSYDSHKQNTNFDLVIQSNNATLCNASYIQYPNNVKTILNLPLTKNGNTFYTTLNSNNFTSQGDVCIGVICTDGLTYEPGSVCKTITASGIDNVLGFYILMIVVIYAIAFVGFFGKNEWVAILGGLAMIGLGLFTINNGVDILRNQITDIFSWTTIGIGSFFAIYSTVSVVQDNL